jgi:putative endonuclease
MEDDWFVYIIESQTDDSFYVGHTHELELRIVHHNDGWTISTKASRPWKLVYSEQHLSKSEVIRREKQIKRMKSRQYIERLISPRPPRNEARRMRRAFCVMLPESEKVCLVGKQ